MCGIAGIIDLSDAPIDPAKVSAMCSAMVCRGPDAYGLEILPYAVLGHRRLSILDLSALGNQPMATSDETLWIVFNGEIYNHKELRRTLSQLGYRYRSRTDTESLLYGFREWGTELSKRCRGMWAFAIWDVEVRSLYLSRDRVGQKPLFYYQQGTRLAFSSTLAGLRPALPRCEISPQAVASLLAYQYIPHTESIYVGVKKVPPAHYLVFNQDGIQIMPYWHLDYRDKLDLTLAEAEQRVKDILSDAIQEQLEADVPVGVFLSGGIDSGYLTALVAQYKPQIASITMTVPGSSMDESANARAIAAIHNVTNIQIPLDQGCIRDLPSILATTEPLADSSLIPTAAVAGAAVQHMKVALVGDGGDELFDGYNRARVAMEASRLRELKQGVIWALLAPLLKFLSLQRLMPVIRLLRGRSSGPQLMAGAGIEAWLSASARDHASPDVRRLVYGPRLQPLLDRQPGEFLIDQLHSSLYNEWWEGILSTCIKARLTNDFLVKVDTATMFHSLEARAPFLDHRLIELTAQLPFECLLPDSYSKSLLRRMAAQYNPPEVVYGPKKGFSIPVERYFLGGWGRALLEMTRDGLVAQFGLLDPAGIRKLKDRHGLRSNYKLHKQLYSIMVLELWLRVFHTREDTPEDLGKLLLQSIGI